MFQAQSFKPMGGPGFLPQVRMAGFQPAPVRPLPGPIMGLSLEDGKKMYEDAKREIAKFDAIADRASKINYKPSRDEIVAEYGLLEPNNRDKALGWRNALQEYVAAVEASTPPNYYVFIQDTTRPRNRLKWVTDANVTFEKDVASAGDLYGYAPEPQVIIKEVQVPGQGTDLTVPILLGAGAVAIALIFG